MTLNHKEVMLDVLLEGNDITDEQRPKIREVFEYALKDIKPLSPILRTILPLLRRALPTADLSLSVQELYETYYGRIKQYFDDDFNMLPSVKEEFLSCLDIEAELMAFVGHKISGQTVKLETRIM